MDDYIENVCRKLRETAKIFGRDALAEAVIIDSQCEFEAGFQSQIGGHAYIDCPTIAGPKLGKVSFKVARFFEDI